MKKKQQAFKLKGWQKSLNPITQKFTAGIYINIHQLPNNGHIVQFSTSYFNPLSTLLWKNAQRLSIISVREIENG